MSHLPSSFPPAARLRVAAVATAAAVALPPLVAWSLPPVSTFFNQTSALGLWGLAIAVAWPGLGGGRPVRATWPLLVVVAAIAGFALAGWLAGPLPASLATTPVVVLAAAAIVLLTGAAAGPRGPMLQGLLWGLVVAGLASACVALVQVFAPGWADGELVARTTLPGRAVGNLRQPNHLATLLLWAAIALVPLVGSAHLRARCAFAALALLMAAIALSGSRTGALGVMLLAAWGLADRRLGHTGRALLIAAPLFYAGAWAGLWLAAQLGAAPLGALARGAGGDPSSSRFAVWANAWALVEQHPWTGVGFGRFNFAWSLTPLPDRPVAFFDHVHNLSLQFAVELGLPMALLLTALLLVALVRAARRAAAGDVARHALLAMLLLVALHSLLEYPLWYVHVLLPACWIFGASLAGASAAAPARRAFLVGGFAMALAALVATADYLRVASIFTPPARAAPLAQRIADGQHSLAFAHHAHYAAATGAATPPALRLDAIDHAAYHLLDTRLMIAWARSLDELGDADGARHLAQRLREFRNPASRDFFAPCGAADVPDAAKPFQCLPPAVELGWRDFVHRRAGAGVQPASGATQ